MDVSEDITYEWPGIAEVFSVGADFFYASCYNNLAMRKSELTTIEEKAGTNMAYENPSPKLYDEESSVTIKQEYPTADYKQMNDMYFAFIDVLGFKQTFDENRKNTNSEFASAFKKTFQYFSLLMNSTKFAEAENQWNAGQTSDSLYFYTDRIDYLAVFIKIYSHFSLFAMINDVFFRGGIAKGTLFVEKPHQFYGDSVIKAYLLECSIAREPRIVLDKSTCIDLMNESTMENFIKPNDPPGRSYVKPFVLVDNSELQGLTNTDALQLQNIGSVELQTIQENIQANMERFEFDDKNYRKYAFLQAEFDKARNEWQKIDV